MESGFARCKMPPALQNLLTSDMQRAAGVTDGSSPMQLVPRYQAALMAARAK